MVGSSFPYSEFLPEEGQARGVQIDIDGRMLGIRYPMEVNLVGDSAETLRALIPLLERKDDRVLARADRRRGRRVVEADRRARAHRRPIRSTRSGCSGSCPSSLPDGAILASTRARRRTGTRATCAPARG